MRELRDGFIHTLSRGIVALHHLEVELAQGNCHVGGIMDCGAARGILVGSITYHEGAAVFRRPDYRGG
jgi:hypothetical protein